MTLARNCTPLGITHCGL